MHCDPNRFFHCYIHDTFPPRSLTVVIASEIVFFLTYYYIYTVCYISDSDAVGVQVEQALPSFSYLPNSLPRSLNQKNHKTETKYHRWAYTVRRSVGLDEGLVLTFPEFAGVTAWWTTVAEVKLSPSSIHTVFCCGNKIWKAHLFNQFRYEGKRLQDWNVYIFSSLLLVHRIYSYF